MGIPIGSGVDEWLVHRVIGHWLASVLRVLWLHRIADRLHDRTLPPHHNHLWDIV
jgi:hypothetical protein